MVYLPHWPKTFIRIPKLDNLSRIEALLFELGNPHLSIPPTIHIAGTNGKGSSCAMFKSIFKQAGLKVHMFSSPHLVYFNERIEIAGEKIDDEFLFEMLETVRLACDRINLVPSFFEAITAAAFLAFSKIPADILILETGMGGRLDPTNVVPFPLLNLITCISYDHMDFLGNSITAIASEKAGIIKQNTPCVISRQAEEAMEVLLKKCEHSNSPAIAYEYDFIPEKTTNGFNFYSRLGDLEVPSLNLLGDHQIINASAVIAAALLLKNRFNLTSEHITCGISKASWPGRLQKYELPSIIKNAEAVNCWLDGAHNIAGAAALSHWFLQQNIKKPIIIVGLTKNRDVASFLNQFNELDPIILSVRVISEASSYSADVLAEKALAAGIKVIPQDSLEEAFNTAIELNPKANILVTGSLYLIADCLKLKNIN